VGTRGQVSRKRRVVAWILLVLAVLLTPLTLATRWVNFEITEEDRFVNTLGPLAEDPEVQAAVADRVTQIIFAAVDVQSLAEDALPSSAAFLAGPLAAGVESFTNEQALRFLETEQFAQLWRDALRVAHRAADALLTGKDEGALQVQDGRVVVDLSTVIQAVVDQLDDRGLTFVENIPTDAISGQIVLFESSALADAQSAIELLNTLSWALLAVGLVCYALSVVALGDARRGLVRVGLGLAVGALSLAVLLAFGRAAYLNATVAAGANRAVQEIVFEQVVATLRTAVRAVITLGVVSAVVAWVLGPATLAQHVRRLTGSLLGRGAEGAGSLGAGDQKALHWLGGHERGLQVGLLVFAVLAFLTRNDPSATTILIIVLVTVVLLGVLSILARAGRAAEVASGDAPPPPEQGEAGSSTDEADSAQDDLSAPADDELAVT